MVFDLDAVATRLQILVLGIQPEGVGKEAIGVNGQTFYADTSSGLFQEMVSNFDQLNVIKQVSVRVTNGIFSGKALHVDGELLTQDET